MRELFSEEAPASVRNKDADARKAYQREKLRRDVSGVKRPTRSASSSVRPKRPAVGAPRTNTGTIPRVQTGQIPRVQTGTIPRVQTGQIPRAQTGQIPRVQTGTITRVQTGQVPRVQTGTIPRVQTGQIAGVNTGTIGRVKTESGVRRPPVPRAQKAKKRFSPGKIAAACLAVLLIGAAVITAVKLIGKPEPVEEPKIIPTDVVAGIDEISDDVIETGDAGAVLQPRHTVRFTFYDKPDFVCNTADIKAGELMTALGIEYEEDKIVSVDSDSEITGDTDIDIKNIEYTFEYETEAIPNETRYVDDSSMYEGEEEVSQEGYDGVKTYTYKVTLVNGEETARDLVGEAVTTEPVDRIINRGTAVYVPPVVVDNTPQTSYVGAPENYLYYVDVRATCYSIVGTTATGLPTGNNVMAVDPDVIPLGSNCIVIGDLGDYGYRIAADVGGGIKGNIIDIWVPEGTGFGWQNARVYVLS